MGKQVDWFRVITTLERHGVPLEKQGSYCGVSGTTVFRWKQGSEPRHCHGEKLLELHGTITKVFIAEMQP